jgi:hypothetical protein
VPDDGARYPHLLVVGRAGSRDFTRQGRGDAKVRDVERRAHGRKIQAEATATFSAQEQTRNASGLAELASLGCVVTLEGSDELTYKLKVESLESQSRHKEPRPRWLLLTVLPPGDGEPERAVVWVSDEYRDKFLELFEAFLTKDTKSGNPRNRELVANMTRIRVATLEDLWQSAGPPPTGEQWWELWLRPEPGADADLDAFAERAGIRLSTGRLRLADRLVRWAFCAWSDLYPIPFTKVPLTEIRRPQFVDAPADLESDEQRELTDDLATRITAAGPLAPAVCLLDSGVRRTHVLIEGSLSADDVHSVVPPPDGDVRGHGTALAGLALFGPLTPHLLGTATIDLRHRLESVKLMPDGNHPPHEPTSYGLVTARAVASPEAVKNRPRTFCLAITADADRPGEPSLWSASVDAIAAGTAIGSSADGIELIGLPDPAAARLIIVSAGNVDPPYMSDYLAKCDLSPIGDPAQAWNVLTVGAYTDLTDLPRDPSFDGWTAVAQLGDISPHTRTGVMAGGKPWPIKPDICMEGGNVLTDGADDFHERHSSVSLTTTDVKSDAALGVTNATSAATAQASRLAALAMAAYPTYWPETIRGLLVQSAEWTPTMRAAINAETGKTQRLSLLKRFGWGVPTAESVLTSSNQAVTMVVQDSYVPFTGDDLAMRHFRMHELPWPRDVLLELGGANVELRVTLSYFIEPNPARRGWRRRYAYASHGLRFELRGPNEDTESFVRRVNREAAHEEDGTTPPASGTDNWTVGPNQRNKGSLHTDVWVSDAASLADVGVLAVHAVGGWWKNNRRKDRTNLPVRYGLLVSLRTPAADVDLYTPVAVELKVPVTEVAIEI